jgi:hypothetical protein
MKSKGATYFGGLNWNELCFNYHPVFMVAGMVFFFASSLVSFRLLPFGKKTNKAIHGLLHTCAMCCVVIGLCAVFIGNNYRGHGGIYSNLNSMHSFIGLTTVVLYGLNYVGGLAHFLLFETIGISAETKAWYLPNHVFIGLFTFFVATMAVETGIMELSTELGCGYDVTQADLDPAIHYDELQSGCKVANGVGIMAILTCFLAFYAVIPSPQSPITDTEKKLMASDSESMY